MMSLHQSVPPLGGESETVACGDRAGARNPSNANVSGDIINTNTNNNNSNNAWLSGLLNSAKNRDTLLRLESGLVTFMMDTAKSRLQLPPCNSFQRRICVEVAVRFGLEHTLDRNPTIGAGHASGVAADPNAVLLVLVKTAKSAIPAVMLSQQISDKPKLVKRPKARGSAAGESTHSSISGGGRPSSIKNVSQEEYEQARARIFKDARNRSEQNGSDNLTSGNSSSSDALDSLLNVRVVGGGIARGPEEGKSFARRRARMQANENSTSGQERTSSNGANGGAGGGTSNSGGVNPTNGTVGGANLGENEGVGNANENGNVSNNNNTSGNMSDGTSLGTVEMATSTKSGSGGDRDDPDFDRCYDKWAVRGHVAGTHQMMYPPQYQQHAYHNHNHRTMTSLASGLSAMSHAQAHAQARAAAVSAYPIVPLYHVPRPAPPPRHMHFFAPFDNNSSSNNSTTTTTSIPHNVNMAPMGTSNNNMGGIIMNNNSNNSIHGQLYNNNNNTATGRRKIEESYSNTPTYGLDSPADFPPLGAATATPTSTAAIEKKKNQQYSDSKYHLKEHQQRQRR